MSAHDPYDVTEGHVPTLYGVPLDPAEHSLSSMLELANIPPRVYAELETATTRKQRAAIVYAAQRREMFAQRRRTVAFYALCIVLIVSATLTLCALPALP